MYLSFIYFYFFYSRKIWGNALEKLTKAKLHIQKRDSYRFSSKGVKDLKPEKVPKRKVVREEEVKEESEEETKKEVIYTSSGRASTKIVF